MPWVKLDDQWMEHPKILRAGRDARDVWLAGLTYCSKYLTDGIIPAGALPLLTAMAGADLANCQEIASRLVSVGLWEATDNAYLIHDYVEYNPTREQVIATREARAEAGRRGGVAKASKAPGKSLANEQQNSAPSPSPSPSPSQSPILVEKSGRPAQLRTAAVPPDSPAVPKVDLPKAVTAYVQNGGKFNRGTLVDGTTKKDAAIQFISAHVQEDPTSLDLWGRVVFGYCKKWANTSYTVMVEYYERGEVPGAPPARNGNGRQHVDAADVAYEYLAKHGGV